MASVESTGALNSGEAPMRVMLSRPKETSSSPLSPPARPEPEPNERVPEPGKGGALDTLA